MILTDNSPSTRIPPAGNSDTAQRPSLILKSERNYSENNSLKTSIVLLKCYASFQSWADTSGHSDGEE